MRDAARFPYQQTKTARGEVVLRPYIPLRLTNRKTSIAIDATGLLDTGADVNVLPYELGVALGAVWDEQQVALELSGNLANYEARGLIVEVTVEHFSPARLAFAWTRAQQIPLILGQVNFFVEFHVCFDGSQKRVEVRASR
jgi:hypothetical protein